MALSGISYWVYIATIYLCIMVVKDYRNKMMVDDRYNFFMSGVSLSLISHIPRPIWYTLSLIVVIMILNLMFKKFQVLGDADINSLSWLFFGFGIIGYLDLGFFAAVFLLITIFYHLLKVYVYKYKKATPFYGVIFISFVVSGFVLRLY